MLHFKRSLLSNILSHVAYKYEHTSLSSDKEYKSSDKSSSSITSSLSIAFSAELGTCLGGASPTNKSNPFKFHF